ncbi:MAG: hypothetical protein LBO72_03505 [Helicobacteraceae bacterium]|nr:hypothetical protein [Helicobacteraceae bacterium]
MREKILSAATIILTSAIRVLLKISTSILKRSYFINEAKRKRAVRYLQIRREQTILCHFLLPFFNVKIDDDKKFILCFPTGGLNDILCAINKYVNYAMRHNRIVYIDGSKSGFQDDFDRYFVACGGGG